MNKLYATRPGGNSKTNINSRDIKKEMSKNSSRRYPTPSVYIVSVIQAERNRKLRDRILSLMYMLEKDSEPTHYRLRCLHIMCNQLGTDINTFDDKTIDRLLEQLNRRGPPYGLILPIGLNLDTVVRLFKNDFSSNSHNVMEE